MFHNLAVDIRHKSNLHIHNLEYPHISDSYLHYMSLFDMFHIHQRLDTCNLELGYICTICNPAFHIPDILAQDSYKFLQLDILCNLHHLLQDFDTDHNSSVRLNKLLLS